MPARRPWTTPAQRPYQDLAHPLLAELVDAVVDVLGGVQPGGSGRPVVASVPAVVIVPGAIAPGTMAAISGLRHAGGLQCCDLLGSGHARTEGRSSAVAAASAPAAAPAPPPQPRRNQLARRTMAAARYAAYLAPFTRVHPARAVTCAFLYVPSGSTSRSSQSCRSDGEM